MRTLYLLAVLVAGLCWLLARDVFAEAADQGSVTQLVIIAYAESVHDRAAEWHVLGKRAARAGTTIEALAQRYVSVFKAAVVGQPRTKWLRAIPADCTRPVGLPAAETWDEEQCWQVRADAEAFLQHTLPDPCTDADDWGARDLEVDAARAAKAISEGRWALAHCTKPMRNAFYHTLRLR